MRVAVLSYPMLFQTGGGLRMKLGRTVDALQARGVDARLIDPVRERLADFDLVHVFAPYNGNHRIVQQARADGLPVLMSTILNPPFSRWEGRRARLLTRLVGRLTGYSITTTFRQELEGLEGADHLVALGQVERRMLLEGYGMSPDKVSVIHNGIGAEFFGADPAPFVRQFGIERPFVLHTGLIGDVKNQLGLVRALKGSGLDVVLIGWCGRENEAYLQRCLAEGEGRVRHLGELPHGELIASAYAACHVVAIPSRHEGMPNSVLEALASDRRVVMTNNHSIDFPLPADVVAQVTPDDHATLRERVLAFWRAAPASGQAREVVRHLSWEAVALQLEALYRRLLGARPRDKGIT